MIRESIIAAALAASCLTVVPAAHALRVKCDKSPYDVDLVVVHGNGVFTDLAGAKANLERLRPLVDAELGYEAHAVSYALAYNERKSLFESLYKLARERLAMSEAEAIRRIRDYDDVPDWLLDEVVELAAERELAGFEGDKSLERHVTMYREHLSSGRKVVVIAHSEGNMYANAAYRRLFELEPKTMGAHAFGIVGVASPTIRLAGWQPPGCSGLGCYTTLAEDRIINDVRGVLKDTAPANVPVATEGSSDENKHDLVETYLRNPTARAQIMKHVSAFVAAFEPLRPTINDAMITAYLDWTSNADLDLHVFRRKTGAHVYSKYPEDDDGGYLDLDDQDGFGPEHYYAECAALERGDFRFAVGYYAGDGPVSAQLKLKIGAVVRTYPVQLSEPTGDASLLRPQGVAELRVVADALKGTRDPNYERINEYVVDVVAAQ